MPGKFSGQRRDPGPRGIPGGDFPRDTDGAARVGRRPLQTRAARIDKKKGGLGHGHASQARETRTSSTRPGSQMTSMFMGAQQTSQSSMVE